MTVQGQNLKQLTKKKKKSKKVGGKKGVSTPKEQSLLLK